MFVRHLLTVCALVAAGASHAAVLTQGQWTAFDVDELTALSGGVEWIDLTTGSPLSFDFTIAAGYRGVLTVVDAGFAGDTLPCHRRRKSCREYPASGPELPGPASASISMQRWPTRATAAACSSLAPAATASRGC